MINITEKKKCCGCAACVGVCPKDCIEMKEDAEGFLYPSVDREKCIDCGACGRVCPILNHVAKKKCMSREAILFSTRILQSYVKALQVELLQQSQNLR